MYLQNKTFRSWWRAFLNQLRMESHWFTATLSPKPTILAVWTLETRILVWRKQNRRSESGFLQYDFVVSAFFWSCFICWNTQRSTEGRAGRAQLQNTAGGEILNCVGRWQRWSVCRCIGFRTTVVRHCTENTQQQQTDSQHCKSHNNWHEIIHRINTSTLYLQTNSCYNMFLTHNGGHDFYFLNWWQMHFCAGMPI